MTPRTFCQSGEKEFEKGAVHCAAAVLMGAMAAYNLGAFVFRKERHLAINASIYAAVTVLEAYQASRHWRTR